MDLIDMLWIEDDQEIVDGILERLKEEREMLGFDIVPFHYKNKKDFDEKSGLELTALVMGLVCIDYNLPGGINGNEIIIQIRSHQANKNIPIIFYSYMKNEKELKEILESDLKDLSNIYFAYKDSLEERILYLLP